MGCYLMLYVFFVAVCFIAEWYILGVLLIVIPLIILIISLVSSSNEREETIKRVERQKLRQKQKEEEFKNVTIPAYQNYRSELISKYGEPAKTIILKEYNLEQEIIAFEEFKIIWICGKDFPMKSILDCSLEDNQRVQKGEIISTTKTKGGNMVKRTVVGNVVLGGAGAVIGGATANKSTITTQGDDTVHHDYTVIINVDSLSEPIIRIPIGDKGVLANEIAGLMNVIINRNQRVAGEL